ncbi:glycoside hydrolase family 43 protein [Cellvibrio fibrivorans]|uniref:Alpha-N-arabinofuranosidase n=1 Tax=Cellvibrio fibrivorans TaxID=126350 RepID=A0ABU1USE4_9GAMM|nr:glycoside hydrolase family 43 protein [Cellvibrio fibrivorans]MDR7088075.1 alpha-N-arabinofuranosidase [Cellvibrio fibrivorans]
MKATQSIALLFASCLTISNTNATSVDFYQFTYEGKDAVFAQKPAQGQFQNPIIAGFYPDPSITRAGDDYYLVTSSFSYSPGVPIFHSKDLVNWKSLGHVLVTPKQLPLYKQQTSRGIYAPTIRYHDGTFYLITTLVDVRGNFIVTAKNPAGPWSDPILLPEVGGIDPDIFFDDDGRVYIAHNDAPVGEPLYEGHRAIWLWEFDPKAKKVIKESRRLIVNGGTDLAKKPVWIEAPHIYKINGWYYLLCAEGGTGYEHSQVALRTKDLTKPFEPYTGNPILTQRDLDINRPNPITTAGHADLIQTKEGEWWAVFLATRAYDKTAYNTGRETFLLPVSWKNEWPIILEQGKEIPYQLNSPKISAITKNAEPTTGNFIWQDNFSGKALQHQWVSLRTADSPFYTLKNNRIQLQALNVGLDELEQPAFLGRRQQHTRFSASTQLDIPAEKTSAGIVALQSETAHYYFGATTINGKTQLFIEQANKGVPKIIHTASPADIGKRLTFVIEGNSGKISFYYVNKDSNKKAVLENADAKILSTEVAGGFVGTLLGIHARAE